MAKRFLLALDAGHGKHVGGNRIPAYLDPNQVSEWELADRVARAVDERAKLYEDFDILRVDDPTGEVDVLLQDRTGAANWEKADFYLSIHFNAGIQGGRGGGVTAYCYQDGSTSGEYMRELYSAVVDAGGLAGNRANPYGENNLFVLRNTIMPAVLLECGFMDSQDDVPVILNPEYEEKIGHAIADTIARLAGLTKKEEPKMEKRYQKVEDVPDWGRPTIQKLVEEDLLLGNGEGLDLSEDMVRVLMILIRILERILKLRK